MIDPRVVEESIANTLVLAGRCVPFLIDPTDKRPTVAFPNVVDNAAYLRQVAHEGLARAATPACPSTRRPSTTSATSSRSSTRSTRS
jgi:DNA polymerase III alpha subunit